MNPYATAAVRTGLAFAAAVVAARTGVAVALILIGVVVGKVFELHSTAWLEFLAGFSSGLLTFLAGAEIDPRTIAKHWQETISIGLISFLFPFLGAMASLTGPRAGTGRARRSPAFRSRRRRSRWSTP